MANKRQEKRGSDAESRSLDVVQRWFQSVISHPEGVAGGLESPATQELIHLERDELERVIRRSRRLSAHQRLSIYANAYYARLVECLGENYPVLKGALGEEVFNSFAFEYLQRYPSKSYTLESLGDRFTQFLAETRPDLEAGAERSTAAADWPDFLIDLATLEWNVGRVFDGPGVEGQSTLAVEDLQAIPPQQFAAARLIPVVCLRLLHFSYPVNAYYTSRRRDGQQEAIPLPAPGQEWVALTRRNYIVRRQSLSVAQHALLETLQMQGTVGEAIAVAAQTSGLTDDELAGQLHGWFLAWTRDGFFQSVELVPER